MDRDVVFHLLAVDDLDQLDDFIAAESEVRAERVIQRIKARCKTLSQFPERGAPRPQFGDGVRLLLCERRIVIAYRVDADRVVVLRIFSAGLDYESLLAKDQGD